MAMASKQLFQTPESQEPTTLLYIIINQSQLKEGKEDILYLRVLFYASHNYVFRKTLLESRTEYVCFCSPLSNRLLMFQIPPAFPDKVFLTRQIV